MIYNDEYFIIGKLQKEFQIGKHVSVFEKELNVNPMMARIADRKSFKPILFVPVDVWYYAEVESKCER